MINKDNSRNLILNFFVSEFNVYVPEIKLVPEMVTK